MQDKTDRISSEKPSKKERQQTWLQKTLDKGLRVQTGTRKRRNHRYERGGKD